MYYFTALQYYKHRRMRSFTRQLNQYSFWKGRSTGFDKGEVSAAVMYNHPNFRRGRPDLLSRITRRPIGEAPPPAPAGEPIGRFNGVPHYSQIGGGVGSRVGAGIYNNKNNTCGSIDVQGGTKRTRQTENAHHEVEGPHTKSNSCAPDSTGTVDDVAWAQPVKCSKENSSRQDATPSEGTSNDTSIQRVSNLACWHEAAADPKWAAFSNGNDGSRRVHDESIGDEEMVSLNEDLTMTEMCEAITKADVAYVL